MDDCKGNMKFSTSILYSALGASISPQLINQLKTRIEEYYLWPAEILNAKEAGFAVCLLCFSTIEFFAQILEIQKTNRRSRRSPTKHVVEWITQYFKVEEKLAGKMYQAFRCGLSHNGQIEDGYAFSYANDTDGPSSNKSFYTTKPINKTPRLVIYPRKLLETLRNALESIYSYFEEDLKLFYRVFYLMFGDNLKRENSDLFDSLEIEYEGKKSGNIDAGSSM